MKLKQNETNKKKFRFERTRKLLCNVALIKLYLNV